VIRANKIGAPPGRNPARAAAAAAIESRTGIGAAMPGQIAPGIDAPPARRAHKFATMSRPRFTYFTGGAPARRIDAMASAMSLPVCRTALENAAASAS
jgi:hypothetical protein